MFILLYANCVVMYCVSFDVVVGNKLYLILSLSYHACQSGNMAILFTSLFFVFVISFLPKYLVNYYDYIIKCCFGI